MDTPHAPTPVSCGEALRFWLRLGFISFGGPAGQIALMHRELVEQRHWISERRFLHALNYCMLLPGPEAQQLDTYIGWLMHRTWGGIVAGALFVLPSLFLLTGLNWAYVAFGNLPWVAGLFYGIKPAVAAIVLQAVHRIGSKTLKTPARAPVLWAIALLSLIAIAVLRIPFPWVVAGAALTGWIGSRLAPAQFAGGGGHAAGKALGQLAQMGWFFTKAALLTFGGTYAVLPYVYQGAVEHLHWLTGLQMIDGLALGETTPGPLIMVVAFVGFLGGWTQQVLGPDRLFLGAALAATVVTWFTFLPSFIFILAGGPLVESTHGKAHFTAPLVAITAAVVGVISVIAASALAGLALRLAGWASGCGRK
jgi:chromate transporter